MARDCLFREKDGLFSYRAAGLLVRNGKLLLQKPENDDGYSFIGGHVSLGETTEETLVREYGEELHAPIRVERLLAVGEVFFPWGELPCHQICLYYTVSLTDPDAIPQDGVFHGYDELEQERIDLDFHWVPLESLPGLPVYPPDPIPHLLSGSQDVLHFVYRENP